MSLRVSLMYVNPDELPLSIVIVGSGIDTANLNLLGPDGVYRTFFVTYDTPSAVKLTYLNPPFINGVWCIGFYSQQGIYCTYMQDPRENLSGIYFLNPNKKVVSDSYYTVEHKIPDPTIRTALIGE